MQRSWGFRRFLSTICYHTDSILLTQKQGKSLDFPNPCGNIPKLRFPEFNGEWEEKRFSDERVRKVC